MTYALYQYRPGNVRSLSLLICHEAENMAHKVYFANALWGILQYASMGKSTFPGWADVFHERRREDEESAEEIKKRIVRELRG